MSESLNKCTSISPSLLPRAFIMNRNFQMSRVEKVLLTFCLSNYVLVEELLSPLSSTYIIQDLKPFNMQADNVGGNFRSEEFSWLHFIPKRVSECSRQLFVFCLSFKSFSLMTRAWNLIKVLFIVDEAIKQFLKTIPLLPQEIFMLHGIDIRGL